MTFGLTQSTHNPTLYFRIQSGKLVGAVTVHVDDMCIMGEASFVEEITRSISSKFEVSSNEHLYHFLSMSISRDLATRTVFLSQEHYIHDLAQQSLGAPHKTVNTPKSKTFKDLCPRQESDIPSPGLYASLVGALLWVTQCTRPDISFVVGWLSQFLCDASADHQAAAV